MFLKNYTSNVPVSQTIHRIEQVLIRAQVEVQLSMIELKQADALQA